MLATRVGERMNIMIDEARVYGPEVTKPERNMAFSPCIQLGSFNALREEEEDMLAWYAQWRVPTIATLPGTIRTRKLVSVLGWAKHAILTEWISVEARDKYFPTHENGRPDMQAWTDKVTGRLIHAPGSSSVAERIWPA